ncbi:hypothetical protein E2P81_ATG07768 [Venturia nashicola]|uniref:Uncharacterized protein n=1 Tax=Venturia nashicola TaxID=86259 RepID=A0A4Z1NX00_9PEZI|nr:hypothetical protein E6O75_ATG07937 [Venturia nashicola]TLD22575.1 hypothetical protein E2P81_ATG07768 [Venturia nashicola]
MGIISKPHFDFKDLSASSYDVIYSYLSDGNEDVSTEIRDAILDIYNDLLYAVQSEVKVILPGRAATPSTSSDDDFVADCVPGPLDREPVQFNVSRSNSITSRHSAVSGLRSLKTRSVGSWRSLGGNISSGVNKTDSMIDPDSPMSLKRLSTSSYSPGSPLRYSYSAIDIEDDISKTPTEHRGIGRRSRRVDLGAQMDGADDDSASARRQQYPTWLTAKVSPVTPIKRPKLAQKMDMKEPGM